MSRLGLHEVYSPPNGGKAVANVIFVHGLFGDPFETWTRRISDDSLPPEAHGTSSTGISASSQKDNGVVFWPHDLLPDVIPDARILTFGYDADVYRFGIATSQNTIHQHANSLLSDVADLQESSENVGGCDVRGLDLHVLMCFQQLPIIFVAYSLGGIVVKAALNQSSQTEGTRLKNIVPATYGVCFLGTPHRGSKSASLGKIAYSITRAALQRPNLAVLKSIRRSSNTLDRTGDSFRQTMLRHDLKIYSFREEKETRKFVFFGSLAVDADSAKIGDGKEEVGSIPEDHSNMTKFAGKFDVGFRRVSSQLRRWIEDIRKSATTSSIEDVFEGYLECLGSLDNAESRLRMNDVAPSHEKTFHWLYKDSLVQFPQWLRDEQNAIGPVFWVQGKPGKSTLMKFAMRDRRTMELLNTSEQNSWLLVGFFFHDRGSLAQKSLAAMLKEILRQILHQFRRLWHVVRPLYVQLTESQHTNSPSWDTEMLQKALHDVTQQRLTDAHVCVFLDALDEHSGDNEQLASLLFKLTKNTRESKMKLKICVASRSWTIFANHFGTCPGFAIHEYTRDDIRLYTTDRLRQASTGPARENDERRPSGKAEILAEQVTDRARGVFIWVRLVVGELAKGIRDGTPLVELEDQLSKMPQELKDLYTNTLKRIEPEYRDETHIMLQIALCSFRPLSLGLFLKCTFYSRQNKELRDCGTEHEMLRYLTSRSGGLLEAVTGDSFLDEDESTEDHSSGKLRNVDSTPPSISDINATSTSSASSVMSGDSGLIEKVYLVQFIHQTVKEFVRDYGHDLQLQSLTLTKASGHLQLLRYHTRPHRGWSSAERHVFAHAKVIEDELPQETEMMISALNGFDACKYIRLTPGLPNSWEPSMPDRIPEVRTLPLLRLAVAANLVTFVRQAIEFYPNTSPHRSALNNSAPLHIAACGPKIVEGRDERLPMIKLLLDLGLSVDSTIRDSGLLSPRPTHFRNTMLNLTPLALILSSQHTIGNELRFLIAEELLKHGANPDHMFFSYDHDLTKTSCLLKGILCESPDMIKLLLQYGGNLFTSKYIFSPALDVFYTTEVPACLPPAAVALFRRDLEVRKVVRNHLESLDRTGYAELREETPEDPPFLARKWTVDPIKMCVVGGLLGVICTGFGGV